MTFGKGYVKSCPVGAVEDAKNASCKYPETKNDCPADKVFVPTPYDNYMRAECLESCPKNTVLYEEECLYACRENFTTNSGKCAETCGNGLSLLKSASDAKRCTVNCPETYLSVNSVCVKDNTTKFDCEDERIEMPTMGVCARCTSSYDGGEYWSRETHACVSECTYLNATENISICESYTDKVNCPVYVSFGTGKGKCYS